MAGKRGKQLPLS